MSISDILQILPAAFLALWAVLIVLVDLWIPQDRKNWTVFLSALGLAISLGISLWMPAQAGLSFGGMMQSDRMAHFFDVFFTAAGLLSIGLAVNYLKRMGIAHCEFYPLLLISVSGMMMFTASAHLLMVFLSLEMFSIPLYILSGFNIKKGTSAEAALKYFLLGAFASGFLLFGIALTFGATGSMQLNEIAASVQSGNAEMLYLTLGGALLMIGLAFKIAVVPFHMWVPDVYQGAPTPVVAFMAAATKAAGFGVLIRLFSSVYPMDALQFTWIFWAIAAVTMIAGNVLAMLQKNIKRMLAYSSIAHAGYMFMVLVVFNRSDLIQDAITAILVYLVVYAVSSFGTWAVVGLREEVDDQGLAINDFAGLWKSAPVLAISMLVFMLSFTGLPFTIGLLGKLFLFRTAIAGGYVILAVIGLLTSLVSAFYYLRLVMVMFMQPGEPQLASDFWPRMVSIVAALVVFGLSIFPSVLLALPNL